MYQVLYRKWRPRAFADVVGQPQVTRTLQNELKAGRIAHAYLFTGSRGTGKTTCAKILAKAVNCLSPVEGDPCGECEICRGIDSGSVMDIVEIDAASNNGVDNIRDLREEANFTPASARYRVYIIDEVHMLSIGAFNALLKTLEEPPAHVVFILATTEVHKLPATILSRCQRFDFHRIAAEEIAARVSYVCEQEGVAIAPEAALLIGRLADGALRDALSLLDQCVGRGNPVTEEIVTQAAGLTGRTQLFALSKAAAENDCAAALGIVGELYAASKDMARLCEELMGHFRNIMLFKTMREPKELVAAPGQEYALLEERAHEFSLQAVLRALDVLQLCLEKMFGGGNRRVEMEMALVRLCSPEMDDNAASLLKRIEKLEAALAGGAVPKPAKPQPPREAMPPVRPAASPLPDSEKAVQFDNWPEVLEALHKRSSGLASFLDGSTAYISGDYVLIDAPNTMAFELLRQTPRQKDHMREAIREVTGKTYRLGPYQRKEEEQTSAEEDPLSKLMEKAQQVGIQVEKANDG